MEEIKVPYKTIGFSILGLVLGLFIMSSIKFIGAGEAAIAFNKFSGKIDKQLSQGLNFVNPITHRIKKYSTKVTVANYEFDGLSSDSQTIALKLAVNYKLDEHKLSDIYQNVQGKIEDTILYNAILDTGKAELGKFRVDDIAKNRESLKAAIENALRARMGSNYIFIQNVSVTNVEFSKEYEKSIQDKMIAEQSALQAKNEKDAAKYRSEAKAIENENLSKTITPLVLQAKFIEKWDGKLPVYTAGSNPVPFLNLK